MLSLLAIVAERNRVGCRIAKIVPELEALRELFDKLNAAIDVALMSEYEEPAAVAEPITKETPIDHAEDQPAPKRRRGGFGSVKPKEFAPDSVYANMLRVLHAFGEKGGNLAEISNATGRRPNHLSRALHLMERWDEVVTRDGRYWHPEFADCAEEARTESNSSDPSDNPYPVAAAADGTH